MWKFFCVLCQDGLKQWNLEKIFKDCGAAHKKHGCFRSMFNVSSHFTAALLAWLNLFTLYSLISERLAWISKGKPIIFDLQQLLTRTFSTQPASTSKWLSQTFVCFLSLPDQKSIWGHAVRGARADEEDQGGSSGVQTNQSHQLWRLPLCARKT